MSSPNMPQEDWSDYASPDTGQADMVSREKVIELLTFESSHHAVVKKDLVERLIEKVRKL